MTRGDWPPTPSGFLDSTSHHTADASHLLRDPSGTMPAGQGRAGPGRGVYTLARRRNTATRNRSVRSGSVIHGHLIWGGACRTATEMASLGPTMPAIPSSDARGSLQAPIRGPTMAGLRRARGDDVAGRRDSKGRAGGLPPGELAEDGDEEISPFRSANGAGADFSY
jgi:hypothetical protein